MVRNIDEIQKLGKDNMDATLKSFGALSKSLQAITVEIADYSKKVFEQSTAATEKLIGAKSLEKAIEVQTDYAKSSYESFVAEATKLGELYADLAREAYKPFESQFGSARSRSKRRSRCRPTTPRALMRALWRRRPSSASFMPTSPGRPTSRSRASSGKSPR